MNQNLKVQVTKFIKAKREKVFDAWTKPEILVKWFGPRELKIPEAQIDLKVGGSFRLDYVSQKQDCPTEGTATGTYKKIILNELLVFTFKTNCADGTSETLVTVSFQEMKNGTQITLTHEQIADDKEVESFKQGWGTYLEKLSLIFAPVTARV